MSGQPVIGDGAPGDLAAIEGLYRDAFPEEDLLPLVHDLLRAAPAVLSLVAVVDGCVAGHIVLTPCGIGDDEAPVALLGPLAVAPDRQRRGIGRALVEAGCMKLEGAGVKQVLVLGDPAFYARLGFLPERRVMPPYPLPPEWRGAWQSRRLGAAGPLEGTLSVPAPWRRPGLWAP